MSELAYPLDLASGAQKATDNEELHAKVLETPPIVPTSSGTPTTSAHNTRSQQPFYIEIPTLSLAEKAKYLPIPESEDELDCIELRSVVGEYEDSKDGTKYYYAKGSGGLARRVRI